MGVALQVLRAFGVPGRKFHYLKIFFDNSIVLNEDHVIFFIILTELENFGFC